ncbi:response regulator receiver protein [Thalassoporum mexicanum PCC 7367]|uniref:response regulator n=1 Tax=Thalassoporum mexicanum TaxID=3457544 RepID=UPI00029FDA39|nr:response regulator [Pseudanabaena sp. PCC 7367]AFY70625.1 response regulator receiver protein [Pseudanabaena sp. PCC 7367]
MADHYLIIDDSAAERHLLKSLLVELGHQVDVIETAAGALEKIAQGKYDAVFLDIVLPDQDGYRFLRQVRSNPQTADQYVVLCSTKKTKLEIDYGLKRAKANDYLPKPVNKDALVTVLAKVT